MRTMRTMSRCSARSTRLSLIIAVHAGWPHYFARDYETALKRFRKALELDENFIPAHGGLAWPSASREVLRGDRFVPARADGTAVRSRVALHLAIRHRRD